MNKILDKMAYGPTVFLGFVFFLMPFYPEPHIVGKIWLITDGAVMETRAWVDVVLHMSAGLVALTKHLRHRELANKGMVAEGDRDAMPAQKYAPETTLDPASDE